MLFCEQINNYEDFKSRFGFKTDIKGNYLVNKNGIRQRKNNIVYLYWKECSKEFLRAGWSLTEAFRTAKKFNTSAEVFEDMLHTIFGTKIKDFCPIPSFHVYDLLNCGVCIDNDIYSVRYRKTDTGKIYKMKIGKYVNKFLEFYKNKLPNWINNPVLRIFFIEEVTELWKNKRLKDQSLKVVVNKDFEAIYNSSNRPDDCQNFNSCMDDDDNWHYYKEHEDLYDAVSLQDEDGLIYARAILVHCFDKNDQPHDYLERIYCNQRMYKDLLFEKAKLMNLFDLYKDLNASCHESTAIKNVSNDQKISYYLYIPLYLEDGDWMSYQDTFKWYYAGGDECKAYNKDLGYSYCYCLDITSETIEIDD